MRQELGHAEPDWIDPLRWNDVSGKRIANEASRIVRIGSGRERVVNRPSSPGKVAPHLRRVRQGELETRGAVLARSLGAEPEKRFVSDDGPAERASVEPIGGFGRCLAGTLREELASLPPRRPVLDQRASMHRVAASLVHRVENTTAGASHLGIVGADWPRISSMDSTLGINTARFRRSEMGMPSSV